MTRLEKVVAHSIYALGLLLILLLPQNEYAWMQQMDPTIDVRSMASSGNALVFIVAVGAVAVLAQVFLVVRNPKLKPRILSGALIAVAVLVTIVKMA